MKSFVAILALVLSAARPSLAAQPVPYLPVPKGAAVILNTGSTNTVGYRIVVEPSGRAEYVQGSARATGQISSQLAAKFFADLKAGMPLSTLRAFPCMKSASFGISFFLWWRGQRSPDISCSGDSSAVTALNDDVGAIATSLHVAAGRPVHMLPNEPRMPMPQTSPSPSPMTQRVSVRAL